MSRKDTVETRNTRTGDARKIDEWTVHLPGGQKAKFDVSMRYEHGQCIFGVKSDHPDFSGIRLHESDLNKLRQELTLAAQDIIETHLSEDWTPAAMLEIRHDIRDGRENSQDLRFSLSLKLRPVEVFDGPQEGNLPTARIRDKYRQEQVSIRAHAEDFSDLKPRSGSLLDPEVKAWMSSPFSRDEEKGLGRTVRRGDTSPEEDLIRSLEAFSSGLSARLSPDRIDREGFPAPEELVDIMRHAVDPDTSPEP